jgi:hypothetical protein
MKKDSSSASFLQLESGMKYVNPDSPHSLDIHSFDESTGEAIDPQLAEGQSIANGPSGLEKDFKPLGFKTTAMIILASGAVAYLATILARRRPVSSLRIGDLKVDHLEVDRLNIKNRERANSSMEESGGVLRFELGSSDVFENGLE